MRKLLMTATALLLTISVITAQRGQGQRGGNDLLSEIQLTTEQREQIKAITAESRAQTKVLRETNDGERPDRATHLEARKAMATKIEAVLTAEQRNQIDALKAERKAAYKFVDQKALKAALKAHTENEVKPVISAARAQFDQFISAEDHTALDRLRSVFASQPKRKAGTKTDQKPTEAEMSAQKAAVQQWKTDHAAEITELKALTEKYDADLKRLQERMAPQRQQWVTEKREIMAKHLPEGVDEGRKAKARSARDDSGKADKKGDRKGEQGEWPRSRAFLLMKV
jgi:Spy/CpxP family protein refolding chaperone